MERFPNGEDSYPNKSISIFIYKLKQKTLPYFCHVAFMGTSSTYTWYDD